jgi:hypothetical protein
MTRKTIAGDSSEIWHQINTDFVTGNNLHDYHVLIQYENQEIALDMVSSPGGSFEGGYDITTLSAPLPTHTPFRFAIFPEDFLNKIGKLFGMQDVITGYREFDKEVIVQTNDPEMFKRVFAPEDIRDAFQNLSGYSFRTVKHEDKEGDHLELSVQHTLAGIELKKVFDAFAHVLAAL